jgi:hypothetical protein
MGGVHPFKHPPQFGDRRMSVHFPAQQSWLAPHSSHLGPHVLSPIFFSVLSQHLYSSTGYCSLLYTRPPQQRSNFGIPQVLPHGSSGFGHSL